MSDLTPNPTQIEELILSCDHTVTYQESMDSIFKALADPTRRALLDALRDQDGQTLSQLEERLDMSRFGVMKHLGILEDAQLINTIKRGRFKHHFLNAVPLQIAIDRWIEPYRAKPMARSLIDLKSQLEGGSTMPNEIPAYVSSIYIKTTQDALWDIFMNPEHVSKYHFMATDAKMEGDRFTLLMPDGSELMANTLISETPKTRMECTFEPFWAPDMPPSRVVYLIEPDGDFCKLTVEHYDLEGDTSGFQDGWARWASGVKTYLETGQSIHFGSAANA